VNKLQQKRISQNERVPRRRKIQSTITVGFICTRVPSQCPSSEIWLRTALEEIKSSTYAAVLFRALQGESATCGLFQGENAPKIQGCIPNWTMRISIQKWRQWIFLQGNKVHGFEQETIPSLDTCLPWFANLLQPLGEKLDRKTMELKFWGDIKRSVIL